MAASSPPTRAPYAIVRSWAKAWPPMLTSVQKISLGFAVFMLVLAATYLYGVRGEALLMDLASMARGLLCF
jgi:hypothetical protein